VSKWRARSVTAKNFILRRVGNARDQRLKRALGARAYWFAEDCDYAGDVPFVVDGRNDGFREIGVVAVKNLGSSGRSRTRKPSSMNLVLV
jgi:hypothetical protein